MRTILTLGLAAAAVAASTASAQDAPLRPPIPRGMMAADADGDGIATRAEVMASADRDFARIDGDGDGTITPAEQQAERDRMVAERVARGGNARPIRPARDTREGPVTREAFRARAELRFARADANADGRIEAGEMRGPGMWRGGDRQRPVTPSAPAPR